MKLTNALLWLKVGDTFGEGVNEQKLIYREMKNGHWYGLIWNTFLEIGSIIRLDDAKYYMSVMDKETGIDFIKNATHEALEYYE